MVLSRKVQAILNHLEKCRGEVGEDYLDKAMESLGVEQPALDKGPSLSL